MTERAKTIFDREQELIVRKREAIWPCLQELGNQSTANSGRICEQMILAHLKPHLPDFADLEYDLYVKGCNGQVDAAYIAKGARPLPDKDGLPINTYAPSDVLLRLEIKSAGSFKKDEERLRNYLSRMVAGPGEPKWEFLAVMETVKWRRKVYEDVLGQRAFVLTTARGIRGVKRGEWERFVRTSADDARQRWLRLKT